MIIEYVSDYGKFETRVEVMAAPGWRRPWPGYWSRWWVEVSYRKQGNLMWTHDWRKDTGGFTLRRAMWKAAEVESQVMQEMLGL